MDNEISCYTFEDASELAKILMDNNYVVMLSREEDLYIVDYVWSEYSDRNDVIFENAEVHEMKQMKECEECKKFWTTYEYEKDKNHE